MTRPTSALADPSKQAPTSEVASFYELLGEDYHAEDMSARQIIEEYEMSRQFMNQVYWLEMLDIDSGHR